MRVGGRGASDPVGSEHRLSREIRKHTVPRHVQAGAVDKFLNLGFYSGKTNQLDSSALTSLVDDICEWVDVMPAIQWALNIAYHERRASTLYHVMFWRVSLTSFLTLASIAAKLTN